MSASASPPPRRARRLPRSAGALSLGALVGLLALACFGGTALRGEPCAIDHECGPQLRCEGGFCGGPTFACGEPYVIDLENLGPNIVLVLDRSGSMSEAYLLGGTRWEAQAALVDALIGEVAATHNLGAILFPSADAVDGVPGYGQDGCPSSEALDVGLCSLDSDPEVAACPGDAAAISAAISASEPRGNSPTVAAIEVARAQLGALHPDLTRAIVLITDDAPNCAEVDKPKTTDPRLVEPLDGAIYPVVSEAAAAGIPTFVVGIGILDAMNPESQGDGKIDGVNPTTVLNEVATRGGQPRPGDRAFYVPEEIDALLGALKALPPATLGCTIRLDAPPTYPQLIDVRVGGDSIERQQAAACGGAGYRYVDDALDTIELCGESCAAYRQRGKLEVAFFCPALGE